MKKQQTHPTGPLSELSDRPRDVRARAAWLGSVVAAIALALIYLARFGLRGAPSGRRIDNHQPDLGGKTPDPPTAVQISSDPALEEAMLRATAAQARATWLAAAVAVVALVLAGITGWGQLALNNEQQRLNGYLLKREQRVYSSRVAVWAVYGRESSSVLTSGLDVSIQNRAPVLLRAVTVSARLDHTAAPTQSGAIELGDLPPCTLIKFRLSPPQQYTFHPVEKGGLSYTGLTLAFSETDRYWRLEPTQLVQVSSVGSEAAPSLKLIVPRPPLSEQLGDCSESG